MLLSQQTLDVLALSMGLEALTPAEEQLNSPRPRNEWITQIGRYKHIIETILDAHEQEQLQYGEVSSNTLKDCRYTWMMCIYVLIIMLPIFYLVFKSHYY